jgi:putative hemolysin
LNLPIITASAGIIATLLVTAIIGFLTLVLGELVPKRLALEKSEKIALAVAKPIRILFKITSPMVRMLSFTTNLIARLLGASHDIDSSDITEEEIRLMINVGEERGIFQETETDMINSIFEFDDTVAREVMTPRTDIVAVSVDAAIDEILDIIVEEGFSRIPVYEESRDNIIGILYIKDIFGLIKNDAKWKISLKDIVRPVYFVPEYKKIDELFKEMQKSKTHIAIVIDEYGGTAGLITIEDLLEEIVGNIFDEYDDVVLDFKEIDENTYIVSGMLSVGEINDLMHIDLPEEEFDTISGMVLSLSGKMPEVGDEVQFENIHFRVEEVDDKRISKIKIEKLDIGEENEGEKPEE